MNRAKLINSKLLFVFDYWTNLASGKVDIFHGTYLVNLKSIVRDMKRTIERIENDNLKSFSDLPFICEEYVEYLKLSYFSKTDIASQLEQITIIIEANRRYMRLSRTEKQRAFESLVQLRELINTCDEYISNSSEHFYDLTGAIVDICIGSIPLENCIELLKVYLSELMFIGYELEMSQEYLKNLFKTIRYDRLPACNIKNVLLLCHKPVEREYTYIFPIKNLYKQTPVRIQEIVFYNPMRKDLLEHSFGEVWHEEDYNLLTFDKADLFDKGGIRNGFFNWTDQEYHNVLHTDCHARLKIRALSPSEGADRARKRVEEILDLLRFDQLGVESKMSVKKSFAVFNSDKSEGFHPLGLNENIESYPNYYINGFDDSLDRSLSNSNSRLNRVLTLSKRDGISKAVKWFNTASASTEAYNMFLGYFICIESLLSNTSEYPTIKKKLVEIVPDLVIMDVYYNELIMVYRYFKNQFSAFRRGARGIPEEIASVEGLDKFMMQVDLDVMRNNFHLFYKYCDSPYIKSIMKEYASIYSNSYKRQKAISMLRKKLQFVISRVYRYRNDIVHSGVFNDFQIELNISFLRFAASVLLNNSMKDFDDISESEKIAFKMSNDHIESKMREWFEAFL